MVYDLDKRPRRMRHSVYSNSSNQVVSALRSRIKSIYYESIEQSHPSESPVTSSYIDSTNPALSPVSPTSKFSSKTNLITDILTEQILINRKPVTIRRVYVLNNKYKIGWVVDSDLNCCMICLKEFAWYLGRAKHHCRACGSLVCHDCSPYLTNIPNLPEDKGSRVCRNCFGLKPGIFTPINSVVTPSQTSNSMKAISESSKLNSNLFGSPEESNNKEEISGNVRRSSIFSQRSPQFNPQFMTEEAFIEQYLEKVKELEKEQIPKYYESYLMMRELIPLDIYKSSIPKLIARGLPEKIAQRIWNTRILWLICTHKDDILKIHLADFRSKYFYDGLDIVEMRAIWHVLPDWKKDSDNLLEKGKAEWKEGFRSKLDDLIYKEMKGTLSLNLIRNPVYLLEDIDSDEEGKGYSHQLHLFDPHLPVLPRFHRSASFMQDAVHSPVDPNSKSPLKTSDPFRNQDVIRKLNLGQNGEVDDDEDLLYLLNESEDFNRTPSSSISSTTSSKKMMSVNERKTVYLDNIEKTKQQIEDDKNNKYRTFFDEVSQDISSPFPISTEDIDDDLLLLQESNHDSNSPLPPRGNAPQIKHQSFSDKSITTPPTLSQSFTSRPLSLNINKPRDLSLNSPQRPVSSRYSYSPSSSLPNPGIHLPRHSLGTTDFNSNNSTPTDSSSYFRNNSNSFSTRPLLTRTSSIRSNTNSPFASSSISFFSPPTTSFNSVSGLCSLNSNNNTPMPGTDLGDRNSVSDTFFSPQTSSSPMNIKGKNEIKSYKSSNSCSASIDSILLPDSVSYDTENDTPSSPNRNCNYESEDDLPYKTPLTQPFSNSLLTPPNNNVTLRSRGPLPKPPMKVDYEDDDINDDDLLEVEEVTDEYSSFVPFKNQNKSKTSSSNSVCSENNSTISSIAPPLGSRSEIKKAIDQCDLPLLKKYLNGHSLSSVVFDEGFDASGMTTTSTSEELSGKNSSLKEFEDLFWVIADRLAIIFTEEEDESKASPIINMILFLIDEEIIPIDSTNYFGKTLLHLAVEVEIEQLGRELVKRGANLLINDKSDPPMSPLACALSASINGEEEEGTQSLEWLLDEYQSTGREKKLIFFAPNEQKIQYLSLFLYYGLAEKTQKILNENSKLSNLLNTPSPSGSTILQDIFVKCQGNFEKMKEPVETFELLVSLGAEM